MRPHSASTVAGAASTLDTVEQVHRHDQRASPTRRDFGGGRFETAGKRDDRIVAADRVRLAAAVALVNGPRGNGDVESRRRERDRGRLADAPARAGDERYRCVGHGHCLAQIERQARRHGPGEHFADRVVHLFEFARLAHDGRASVQPRIDDPNSPGPNVPTTVSSAEKSARITLRGRWALPAARPTEDARNRRCVVLEFNEATKRFGPLAALDGCTFAARPGRLTGFLGPNGAGKTTAMRAVFGLVELDSGIVQWKGAGITSADRARFGYMPEERGLYPRMRVRDQLVYLGRLCGPSEQGRESECRHLAGAARSRRPGRGSPRRPVARQSAAGSTDRRARQRS